MQVRRQGDRRTGSFSVFIVVSIGLTLAILPIFPSSERPRSGETEHTRGHV